MAKMYGFAGPYLFAGCIVVSAWEGAAAQGAPPPAVSVTPVISRQVTATGDFIGRVVAIDKVDVVARISGFINERNFTEGQQVKTGDLLFSIEPDTYKAAVDQQAANLAKAKATEVNANLQLQRGQELLHNQNIPQSEVDQRAANAQAAHADVMQAEALLEQAKINLGYTEIRSPIDGRIGPANFTVGNLVSPSQARWRRSSVRIRFMSRSKPARPTSSRTSTGSGHPPIKIRTLRFTSDYRTAPSIRTLDSPISLTFRFSPIPIRYWRARNCRIRKAC
jgi:multidrug efflux pump subunit AcrA (membrane-fusion protein)